MARKLFVAVLFGLACSVTLYAADEPDLPPLPRPVEDKKPDTGKLGKFGGRFGGKLGDKLRGKLAGKIDPERVKEFMDTVSKIDPETLKALMEKVGTEKLKELIQKIDTEKLKAIQDALGKGSAEFEKWKELAEKFKKGGGKE